MSRKLPLIVIILGISSIIACYRLPGTKATEIIWKEGHITADETWFYIPDTVYRVIGDVYVDPGVTLTIEHGVRVEFADDFSLIVEGSLTAIGTEANVILFTSSRSLPKPGAWNTIKFEGNLSEQFMFKHTIVEYATHGITIESLGLVTIEKNHLYDCSESGINIFGESNTIIKDCTIERNRNGIATDSVSTHSGIKVINNVILSNQENGVHLTSGAGHISNVTLQSNTILSNNASGISLSCGGTICNITFSSNTLCANGGNGIYARSSSNIGNVTITWNNISSNGGNGIYLDSYVSLEDQKSESSIYSVKISDNIIHSNQHGVFINSQGVGPRKRAGYAYIHDLEFLNNSISNNAQCGIYLHSRGKGSHYASGGGYISNISAIGNYISLSNQQGIFLHSHGEGGRKYDGKGYGYISNLSILNNTILSSGKDGLFMFAQGDGGYDAGYGYGNISNLSVSNNNVSLNKGNGIYLFSRARPTNSPYGGGFSTISEVVISRNSISFSGKKGVYIQCLWYSLISYSSSESNISNLQIVDNTISVSGEDGIHLFSDGTYAGHGYISNVSVLSCEIEASNEVAVHVTASQHSSETTYDVMISRSNISAGDTGIHLLGLLSGSLTNCSISYCEYGIFFEKSTSNLAVYNDIYSNSYGINVTNGATVDAENNYWGHLTGPYHESLNPEGQGNSVNGDGTDLDFIPFLNSSIFTINERPIAVLEVDKTDPNVSENITFDAISSTDDGRVDYYFFDFGDGTNSSWTTLPIVTHKYAEEGQYNTTLIVMDDFGVTSLDGNLVYIEITVVPEFPSLLILPLFMIAALLAVIIHRSRHFAKPKRENRLAEEVFNRN